MREVTRSYRVPNIYSPTPPQAPLPNVGGPRPDNAIHWIAIFPTFVKLAVDRYASFTNVALFAIRWIAYLGFVQPAPEEQKQHLTSGN